MANSEAHARPGSVLERGRSPVVDVHAHLLLSAVEELVADRPALVASRARELASLGTRSAAENGSQMPSLLPRLTTADARIAHLDAVEVDAQPVSVSPAQYHYRAERGLAREIALAVNEGVLAHCASRAGRLTGVGVVPLQHPDLAVELLEHAMSLGLKGIEVSTVALDVDTDAVIELSDPRLDALWQRAADLEALVLVHPFGCTLGPRLDRSYLANVVGQPLEHAAALSQLIFGGVFDRHPSLRLLAMHGGGHLPAYLGRSDRAWYARRDAHSCAEPPSHYLSKFFVDSLVLDPGELRRLVARMGADHVLMGSDYPFDMGEEDPVDAVRRAGLDEATYTDVVVVIPFDTEAEAVEIANGTDFGLVASVYTADLERAMRVAGQLEVGAVFVNNYDRATTGSPFGGTQHSGYGREHTPDTLSEFGYTRTLRIPTGERAFPRWPALDDVLDDDRRTTGTTPTNDTNVRKHA